MVKAFLSPDCILMLLFPAHLALWLSFKSEMPGPFCPSRLSFLTPTRACGKHPLILGETQLKCHLFQKSLPRRYHHSYSSTQWTGEFPKERDWLGTYDIHHSVPRTQDLNDGICTGQNLGVRHGHHLQKHGHQNAAGGLSSWCHRVLMWTWLFWRGMYF